MNHNPPPEAPRDRNRRIAGLTALIMAHGLAAGASGQSAPPPPPGGHGDSEQTPIKLPQVTVEGETDATLSSPKFTVPLRDVPQTITVIPQELMAEQGATSLRDILRNSPGITFQAGEGGTPAGDQMTIRGFSARTDMFVDGVRDLGGYARDSFNLEQVEVAKGPSSAVAGRGTTGGSVNLVTKRPRDFVARSATAAVGTAGYRRATVDFNQPIAANPHAALRVNALGQDADVPGRDVAHQRTWGVAPSLALGVDTPTTVVLSYQHLGQRNVPDYGLPRQAFAYDPPVPSSNFYGLRQRDYERIHQDLGTVEITHRPGDMLTLRNLTRFGRTRRDSVITAPRFVADRTDTIRRSDWKSRDQSDKVWANQTNLTTGFVTGSVQHEIAAGLELSRETERNYNRVEQPGTVLPDTDLYAPDPDDPYTGHITRDGAYTDGRGDTVAAYVFDTLRWNEHWQVTGGVRYDNFRAVQTDVAADGTRTRHQRRDEMVSSRAALVYKPAPGASIYAGVANAYNPSAEGLSLATRRSDLSGVAPEKTRTYELGAKGEAFDGRLGLGAALFRTAKTNARTPGIDPNDPPQVLAGRQRVEGVELSAAGRLTRQWDLFAGVALMDSEVEASNTPGEEGNELGLTPRRSANLWTTYRFPGGLTLGAGVQYLDSVYRGSTTAETVPAYALLNAMVGYRITPELTLRLNATNLADRRYIDRVGGGHHIPGNARQFIFSAYVRF